MLDALLAKGVLLNQFTLQTHRLKFYAVILYVDVEIAVARADAAIAFNDP
jgi:hypothetical protein